MKSAINFIKSPDMTTTWLGFFNSPVGWLRLAGSDSALHEIAFHQGQPAQSYGIVSQPVYAQVTMWLTEYFDGADPPQPQLTILLHDNTSGFQQTILHALVNIPVGQTRTYGELAKQINSCAQAVGQAMKRNPTPVLIPCHRVVAQTGIGGFSGAREGIQIERKQWLLAHENLN